MRTLLFILFNLIATQVAALCSGADFAERLTEQERLELAQAVAETPNASGILWEATREDKSILVIGTMHIFDPRLEPIFLRVKQRIATTELLLVEATAEEEAKLQEELANNPGMIFITDGPTLPEQLSQEDWENVMAATRARSIPSVLAAKMKPWYLSLTLAIPPCAMAELASGQRGLDQMLMNEALRAGTPQMALEPYSTLFDIMQGGTQEEQLEMLKMGLLDPNLQSEMFVGMLNAYFSGHIAEIWEMSRIATRYVPSLDQTQADLLFEETEQLLLTDRNLSWMPIISHETTRRDDIVIAVGAAHLPGESGILQLLENKGWAINPYH